MKNLSLIISIIAIALSSFIWLAKKQEIAYVDVNRIIEGYERSKIVNNELKLRSNRLRTTMDSLLSDWKLDLQTFEKERSAMTGNELELKEQLLQKKQQQLGNYQQAIEEKIMKTERELTQNVINDINEFVKQFGKVNGYQIIHGATGSGNLMYADDILDITDEVLLELNKQFQKG